MRRLYQAGEVGEFKYGEGEYVHPDPAAVKLGRSVGVTHWRNCTYDRYCRTAETQRVSAGCCWAVA